VYLGIIFIVLVCDGYHKADGIVRNVPCARTVVQENLGVLIRIGIASHNGNTNTKKAKKILGYMFQRSAYRVQSKYCLQLCKFFQSICWALVAWWFFMAHHNTLNIFFYIFYLYLLLHELNLHGTLNNKHVWWMWDNTS